MNMSGACQTTKGFNKPLGELYYSLKRVGAWKGSVKPPRWQTDMYDHPFIGYLVCRNIEQYLDVHITNTFIRAYSLIGIHTSMDSRNSMQIHKGTWCTII